MKKTLAALVVATLFFGPGIPYTAMARDFDIDDGVYWSRGDVEDLLSPGLMRSLNLSRSQRSSLDDILQRNLGRHDYRAPRGLPPLPHIRRPGGGRIVIEEKRDNLNTFVALLSLGIMLSRMQDDDRYYHDYYDYIRIDDFLYMFFRILDMNQRRTFRIYFDRWYDDRYYSRPYRHYDYNYDRYRRDALRELERKLRLNDLQRRRFDRELREYYDRRREIDRHYRDVERDYLRKNFERPSRWNHEEQRRQLARLRREDFERNRKTTDRFRSFLDSRQREIFDSMRRDRDVFRRPGPVERPRIHPSPQGPPKSAPPIRRNQGEGGK